MGRGEGSARIDVAVGRSPACDRSAPHKSRPGRLVERRDASTDSGLAVTLQTREDINDSIRDPWSIDVLEAFADGEPAGYLKIAYIAERDMERFYPSAIHWAIGERSLWPGLREQIYSYPEWGRGEYEQAVRHTSSWNDQIGSEELREKSLDELRDIYARRRRSESSIHQDGYERFRSYWSPNAGLVDFIRVYGAGEPHNHVHGPHQEQLPASSDRASRSFQRQGLGLLLYQRAAQYLSTKQMKLFASSTQSDQAQAAWQRMERQGLVREDGGRRYIDPSL